MPPVVVAFPDCFTRLGGNQYINSASMGAWEDFLLHEMLPAIEQRFKCGGNGGRGVFGKSSGGDCAITNPLRHPPIWVAAPFHSGDIGFELCYLPDIPPGPRAPAGAGNSIERWWQQLEESPKHSEGSGKVINRTCELRRRLGGFATRTRDVEARARDADPGQAMDAHRNRDTIDAELTEIFEREE